MIFAGRLRHRVTIQQLVAASPQQTASGQPDESWSTYLTVWAAVEPLNGRELYAAQEHHAEVTTRIRMRHRSGVTAKMRVTYGGMTYDIKAIVNPEERNRELQLLCAEGVNQG